MTIRHVMRRGTAMAAGGALVIGAGSAVGLVTGRMHRDWAAAEQRDAAAVQAEAAAQQVDPSPVVVHEVVVQHVTPDPVVVHRTVTRHVAGRPRTQVGAPRAPRVSRPAASRTVVAPAPRPAPARRAAPSATTSKTS